MLNRTPLIEVDCDADDEGPKGGNNNLENFDSSFLIALNDVIISIVIIDVDWERFFDDDDGDDNVDGRVSLTEAVVRDRMSFN